MPAPNIGPNGQELLGDFTPTMIYTDRAPDTVRIVSTETASGFVLINKADFNPATMQLYEET